MSSLLSVELAATCNALGKYDPRTKKYLVDAFTLGTVKDLIRFLRRDGDDHEIRRHLGQSNVLQTDLVPMLIDHWEENELFDVSLRLLVNLTNPALLLYREEVPTERTARHNYLQILSHLQAYKTEAFTKVEFWDVIAKKLAQVLEIKWQERDEDTGLIIERILILIRNILQVPADDSDYIRPQSDASVHDQVLWALNRSNVLDIILYMSSEQEKQYFMHILEIISHLLREQNPSSLADAAMHRSVDEKLRDEQELLSIRMSETKQKNDKVKLFSASRHSRFGGTYVMQNMKSVSDNDVVTLKPLNKITNLDFGGTKLALKRPKNRRPVESENQERRSAFAIRLFLKEFCLNFLNGSYNPLMHYVRDVLVRAKAQQNDESYYLWVLKFFMEFNRGHEFQVGLVSETMSVEIFHYVQQQMENYFDMIKVDKKKGTLWVKRLHLALRAYKELLTTLQAMDKSQDPSVRESAKVLKSNFFYVVEYREFILTTFLKYDDSKMPRSYLLDLVETTHLFLKMLEHFCKKTGLVVQKKIRKKNSKKKKAPAKPRGKQAAAPAAPEPPPWEQVRAQLAAVLAMSELPDVPPFDAASDTPIDTQRTECVKKIQKSMMESKYEEAIGLLRSARDVWPEEGIFGTSDIPLEEELNMLESIYEAELGVELENAPEPEENAEDGEDEEDEEEEEREPTTAITESEFQFSEFAYRFSHPRVASACSYLLERFDKNLPHTNHCAIKMLHRIGWDSALPAMLYQASLFRTFQKVLQLNEPQYKELEKFALFILRKFSEAAATEPKLFLELLFWKKTQDAKEIQVGYVKYDHSDTKPGAWTEVQEDELRALYMENQRNPQTNQDVIDWIQENLIDQTRTRRSIIKKLKDLGLIFRAPTKKSNVKEKVPVEFTEVEDDVLTSLWAEYEPTFDPIGAIISRMPMKRPKHRLVDRLLELGLIKDKKECRKKRSKKSDERNSGRLSGSGSEDGSSSDSESDRNSPQPVRQKKIQPTKQMRTKRDAPKQRNEGQRGARLVSSTVIAKTLIETVEKDMSDALLWLAECLEEVALDQEAEGFDATAEGVPLVPISTEAVHAMEQELFKRTLLNLGMAPPCDEQEIYWRIPSSLPCETLRKRREVILKAVDKTLIVGSATNNVENHEDNASVNDNKESSDEEDVFTNLRKIREANPIEDSPAVQKSAYRKRTRSVSSEDNRPGKMHKIDEANSEDEISDDDILGFAKKNLPDVDLPDTEDLFDSLRRSTSDANPSAAQEASHGDNPPEERPHVDAPEEKSSDEEEITMNMKRRRNVIDDDSD